MPIALIARACLVWLGIAILAIVNGLLRDGVIAPLLGHQVALPISGISLSLVILITTYLAQGFLDMPRRRLQWLVGIQWLIMTLAFEFGFGHFVAGKSWPELLQSFNPLSGDLFLLVLCFTLSAPALTAIIREKRR